MSWPYSYTYHPQPSNAELLNSITPYEAQLMLHIIRQKSLLDSLPSPFLNFHPNTNPFSPVFNRPQHSSFAHCETLLPFTHQLGENHHIRPELKKQQSLSNLNDQSDSSQNSQLPMEQLSLHIQGRRSVPRPKNMISHNSSLRNDTKNIPKNYGKAMLSYIQKNSREVKEVLSKYGVDYLQFMVFVKSCKSKINTMHDLREMWGQNQKDDKFKKCTRILSYHFMRKKCLPYIFNSRIKNFHTHIKYRKKIMEGIQNPQNFTKIKEF